MATLRTIRLRIKGTKNIKQITRAMEAVSAVKMRKSQSVALMTRPYATAALRLLRNLHAGAPEGSTMFSPFSEKREVHPHTDSSHSGNIVTDQTSTGIGVGVKNVLLIVVTSDKGLAGSFNANVLKKAEIFIKQNTTTSVSEDGDTSPQLRREHEEKKNVIVATIGKKAGDYFSRRGRTPMATFTGFGDYAELAEVNPIFEAVMEAFTSKKVDEIYIIYTNFLSAMKQEVVLRKLLPFSEEGLEEMVKGIVPEKGRFAELDTKSGEVEPHRTEYLFEPSPSEIFNSILPALLKIQLYHAILEANASEHSSRMVAMRNATDNAGELIKSYTVSLNKARQSAINKELAEITGGSEALTV